ncbi:MAG TPA: bifunctional (p)ppGpp synthetase/guanosine-3',5'-bis(diphosphate) 3'-pyrophosphohydrolase, partial [Deltaproteobacteria bacterium]|nr:bifunctional (p)ppGpp synthetase/guanosine-3',5'-bis(diphosphate) 3'-pyrophosphohydrolase [Deltaproteobacteria bacterium]
MVRIEDILERVTSYNPSANLDIIKQAYIFSAKVHKGQTRISGEPYLAHPLAVAKILTDLKMDVNAVATGLLHDTVEDTFTTIDEIRELFGEEIANLVDALTKLSHIAQWKKEDVEAENFRKMLLAMAKDIRVVLIKLADRLHNMRTLSPLPREKQKKIAQETLDIYAPLANRLGIGWIKTELEDLSFKYLEPERYRKLKELIIREEKEKERYISVVTQMLSEKLKEHKI